MYLYIQVYDLIVVLSGVLLSICPVYVYNGNKWASIDQRLVERDLLCYCVPIPDKESIPYNMRKGWIICVVRLFPF